VRRKDAATKNISPDNNNSVAFEQVSAQLKSYILRIIASVEDTEDIVQASYKKAQKNLPCLKNTFL